MSNACVENPSAIVSKAPADINHWTLIQVLGYCKGALIVPGIPLKTLFRKFLTLGLHLQRWSCIEASSVGDNKTGET